MKTQLIYCLPLYIFCAGCLLTLLYYFIPVGVLFFRSIPVRKILNYTLTGFLTIAVIYVIITSLFI